MKASMRMSRRTELNVPLTTGNSKLRPFLCVAAPLLAYIHSVSFPAWLGLLLVDVLSVLALCASQTIHSAVAVGASVIFFVPLPTLRRVVPLGNRVVPLGNRVVLLQGEESLPLGSAIVTQALPTAGPAK